MRNPIRFALAIATLVATQPLAAQQAEAWRDRALRLQAESQALRDSLWRGDTTAREIDRHGSVVLRSTEYHQAPAIAAFAKFNAVRDHWFGDALPSSGGFRIEYRVVSGQYRPGVQDTAGTVVVGTDAPAAGAPQIHGQVFTDLLADNLLNRYGELMIASVPALAQWVENPPPLAADEKMRQEEAMYSFVTAMGALERRCVAGDIAACHGAMGFAPVTKADSAERFALFLRNDLYYFALTSGGDGAWARLSAAADSGVAPALAAAANVPVDTLLSRWRAGLLARRPASAAVGTSAILVALAWAALLIAAAIGGFRWV